MSRSTAELEELRKELRGDVPPGFAVLEPSQLAALTRTLREAVVAEQAALTEATDHGLSFVPGILRGTVKKVLFG